MSRRRASLLLAAALWLTAAGAAHACGVWSLRDREQGWLVVFRSIAVEVVHHRDVKKTLLRFDPGRRQWRLGDGRAFSLRGGTILLDGRKVGTWADSDIEIGKRHFLLAFGEGYKPAPSPYSMIPDNDGRTVTVSEGGSVVLEGAAPSEKHCAGTPEIALYLGWSEVVMDKRLGK